MTSSELAPHSFTTAVLYTAQSYYEKKLEPDEQK